MNEILNSAILGIIQGLTEFLPVSSSGHLEIAKFLLNDPAVGEQGLLFTIMVHFATALSTVYIFRKDLVQIFKGLVSKEWNEHKVFSIGIVISMIPAAIVGFTAESLVEQLFNRRIAFVGSMLFVTAVLLYLADRARSTEKPVSYRNAFIVGLAQAVAILPGISRSGATIATSVLLGIDRYKASRFSFLMVVPLILGKVAYDLLQGELVFQEEQLTPVIVAFVAAFISGAFACRWMIKLVQRSQLKYFSWYCVAVGIFAIILSLV